VEYMDSHWYSVELTIFPGDSGRCHLSGGRVYSGESVRVTIKDVTGWRAVNLSYIGRGVEERGSGLPNPGGGRVSDVSDKTALANKSVVFPAGCGLKDCRVGHGDLEEARLAVRWKEGRVGVCGADRALRERDDDP